MNAITLLFSGLTLAGLYMFGLAVKAMYLCLTNPSTSSTRKISTILFGNVVFLLGIALAGVALSYALNGAIGKVAHALLTFALLLCSAVGQVKFALRRMAKKAQNQTAIAPVIAPAAPTTPPVDTTSETMAEVFGGVPRVEPTLDLGAQNIAHLVPSDSAETPAPVIDTADVEGDAELEAFEADQAAEASPEVATVALAKAAPAANDPAPADAVQSKVAPAADDMDDWIASQDSVPAEAQAPVAPVEAAEPVLAEPEVAAVAAQQEMPFPGEAVVASEEVLTVEAAPVAMEELAEVVEPVAPAAPAAPAAPVAVAANVAEAHEGPDVDDILANHMDIESMVKAAQEDRKVPLAA